MAILKIIALIVVILYLLCNFLMYFFQTNLLFQPQPLSPSFKFDGRMAFEEVFIKTDDGEKINALFFAGKRDEVILYFHGNAGNLNGWQFVAEDFASVGVSLLVIDYRGYGKSTGQISERGFYSDARAAYDFLVHDKEFRPENIIVYGRSIGTGSAVDLAAARAVRGVVLESPYVSIGKLANEKVPFFFPSLYLRYRFDNLAKVNRIKAPVVFIHGSADELIPASHSMRLMEAFHGKKKMVTIAGGGHNDLNEFTSYQEFLAKDMLGFFNNQAK